VKEPLALFRKLRATTVDYARTTGDDLRGRRFQNGAMDALAAAHAANPRDQVERELSA
jgi:hypothetical protein